MFAERFQLLAMKAILVLVSIVLVACGLWLIAAGFGATDSRSPEPGPTLAETPAQKGNPILVGTLLVSGGVVFLVMVSRKRS
jgi:hypothetical protein